MKQKTQHAYWIRAAQLIHQCSKDLSLPKDQNASPITVANWLVHKRPKISKNTWRHYKAALMYALPIQYEIEGEIAADLLAEESQTGAMKKGQTTSALKAKYLPPDDLQKILIWLSKQKSSYARPLTLFLLASILTGLRPGEWQNAVLVKAKRRKHPYEIRLCVRNAKTNRNRGRGIFRFVILNDFAPLPLAFIEELHEWKFQKLREEKTKWSSIQASLARLLSEANSALWPKRKHHYTLYSCRHQAAANFKQMFVKDEVAAIMGHKSLETAGSHYGKARKGQTDLLPNLPLSYPIPPQRLKKVKAMSAATFS
ncbi:hypothetical protein V5T82_04490 [Magnetovibrio sp. PR-2]|uniref:hypothetical protein n=1 Tax=Magnetovibrio sp. PR-2 TaxID=3120356 RepID=UPI002FCE6714